MNALHPFGGSKSFERRRYFLIFRIFAAELSNHGEALAGQRECEASQLEACMDDRRDAMR